jgi:hypothetical protein
MLEAWVHLHLFLTPALDEGEWSTSSSAHFAPRKNWSEGWVGPTAGMTFCKEKSPAPTLNHPAGDLVTTLTICQGWVKYTDYMPGMSKIQSFYLWNATCNLISGTWNTTWNFITILPIFIKKTIKSKLCPTTLLTSTNSINLVISFQCSVNMHKKTPHLSEVLLIMNSSFQRSILWRIHIEK